MRMTRTNVKANVNKIARATGADKGILNNISESLATKAFKELNIDILEDFPNHKFNSYNEKDLKTLADNIKMIGLLDPITVWDTKEGHYYILCGHNRVRACKLAGIKKVVCNIKHYNNINEAKLAVIASNIDRRGGFESLSIEERCLVIVEDFDTLKKLYKEDKEKYGLAEVIGFEAKKEVAIHYQLSASQASIYYKVGKTFKKEWIELIPKHFNLKTAYQLSNLQNGNLKAIMEDIISAEENEEDKRIIKINENQAKEIRQMEKDGVSVDDMILTFYHNSTKKENKKEYKINFTNETFAPYYEQVKTIDENTLQSIFLQALANYFEK